MYRLPTIAAALALLLLAAAALPAPTARSVDEIVICIDPGHSTLAGGASVDVKTGRGRSATVTTLTEAEVNVDVALAVAWQLRSRFSGDPVRVVLTWGEDDGLTRGWDWADGPAADDRDAVIERGAFCEAQGGTIVVSLHTNAAGVPFNGTLTGYRDAGDLVLAELAHPMIFSALRITPEGKRIGKFRNFGLEQADWWISLGAPNSAVAVFEPVLMTERDEGKRLLPSIAESGQRRQQIADIEAAAIAAYVNSVWLAP